MKVTINIGWLIFFGLVLIAIVHFLSEYIHQPAETVTVKHKKDFDIVTLKLPNTHDTRIFGPEYWKAFHKLSEMIPCPKCQVKAVAFMKFFHDVVNKDTGKRIMYQQNYDRWIKKLCDIPKA